MTASFMDSGRLARTGSRLPQQSPAVPARTHTTKTTRKHRAGSTETGGCHNTKVDAAMKPSRIVGRLCYNGVGEVHITFIMQQIVCNDWIKQWSSATGDAMALHKVG